MEPNEQDLQNNNVEEVNEINITSKDMLDAYTKLDLDAKKVEVEIAEFKEAHKEVFNALKVFENKLQEIAGFQQNIQSNLLTYMREHNTEEDSNDIFRVKYTPSYTKKNFDTKKFYEDYAPESAMYKKYVGITTVKDSVKISEVKKK
jgi:hypothetical protein